MNFYYYKKKRTLTLDIYWLTGGTTNNILVNNIQDSM